MRRVAIALVAFCAGIGVASAVPQRAKDATLVDPEVHHVTLENEHVRVLEVRAAPGYTSPMHSHPPLVGISIGSARAELTSRDGQKSIMDLRPGMVFWLDGGAEHTWKLLAGNLHVVAVEVKAARPSVQE
jgi:quercetin dioxygenase-like cupin family protein